MLRKVLEPANLSLDDLPKIGSYVKQGRNTLCYNYVLGHCTTHFCNFKEGHAPATDITDEFARDMIAKLEGPLTQQLRLRLARLPHRNDSTGRGH